MQSKENLIHFHLCRIQYFTFQILTETRILILDQEAWGQNISFLELVLWLLMALDGPVKSILMRLGFEGLSSCTPREGCEKIKVWKMISKLKHQKLNIEPQKGTDWMKRSYHWIYFSRLIQCPTLWHCFFWGLAISRAHTTDAILSHFCQPVIRLIPSIGSLVTKLLCASKIWV